MRFRIVSEMKPAGDQPAAIASLSQGLEQGRSFQTLLGITGSGKTFSVANVIQQVQRPCLVIAPNKTLAAQLYGEMSALFPENAVEYFVSYYDYYQPEAYLPVTDTYIEKDAIMNERIDRLRHSATRSLLSRSDVIIVASVSCIYGMGSAESYREMTVTVQRGERISRDKLLRKLVDIQYERNDTDFHRGVFRVRGDVVEIFPAYEEQLAVRVELWGDEVERISEIDPLRGRVLREIDRYGVFPGSHYVTPEEIRNRAADSIREELRERLRQLQAENKLLERQRLQQRTLYDLEMLEQTGFCHGIENYSRHFSLRAPGEPPPTLIDYLPLNFFLVVDESHQTVPQFAAMYRADRSRKQTLVEHGFRLPSALDNRPLKGEEFWQRIRQAVFVSATPGDWELEQTGGEVIEQLVRPTGLVDPAIEVRPAREQVDDLLAEIRLRVERNERVLVTTLTKRMAEDLTEYLTDLSVRCRYLHSDVETLERTEILRDLRRGVFDVLIGINLLREGLDLPEVSLVAILDADKEGFLRSTRALVQTIGRASRNLNGRVIMYGERVTAAMRQAIDETERRREIQLEFNRRHGITPQTVKTSLREGLLDSGRSDYLAVPRLSAEEMAEPAAEPEALLEALHSQMLLFAEQLEFEKAAEVRNRIAALRESSGRGRTKPVKARNVAPKKKTSARSSRRR